VDRTRSSALGRISKQGQASYPGTALYVGLGTSGEVTVGKETENGGDANARPMTKDMAEGATERRKLAKEAR